MGSWFTALVSFAYETVELSILRVKGKKGPHPERGHKTPGLEYSGEETLVARSGQRRRTDTPWLRHWAPFTLPAKHPTTGGVRDMVWGRFRGVFGAF